MKSFAVVAVLASVAVAQLPNIPSCAINCFVSALSSDGCSSLTDFKCHCEKPQLISTVQPCVQKACSAADQATVIQDTENICKQAGVPISIPSSGGASSAAPAPASSAAAGGESSSAAAGGYSAPATSAASMATGGYGAPTMTYGTPSGTAAATPSAYTGAAAQITQGAALLAGLAVAVAAM